MITENNNPGFTLIEVLISILILTVGILSVWSMQLTSVNGNHTAMTLTSETNWASYYIEEIIAASYDSVTNSSCSTTSPDGFYTVSCNVTPDSPASNMKTIYIIVQNNNGKSRTVSLKIIKTKLY